jgi:hypothetical protein
MALEILTTYCLARWWLARLSFAASVDAARDVGAVAPWPVSAGAETTRVGLRLGAAVERALHVLPLDSRCLVKALVLTRMLARRGIGCSLVLGVRAEPAFAAHAWVEVGGVALLPTTPEFERLTER